VKQVPLTAEPMKTAEEADRLDGLSFQSEI
jgi:hypothetical protein